MEEMQRMRRSYALDGVTTLLPTLASAPLEQMLGATGPGSAPQALTASISRDDTSAKRGEARTNPSFLRRRISMNYGFSWSTSGL